MIRALLKSFIIGSTIAMAIVTAIDPATALSSSNIFGSWCGLVNNVPTKYSFARDTLTVTHPPSKKKIVLNADRYDYSDSTITLHYFASGTVGNKSGDKPFFVGFGNFSSDGQKMDQQPNENSGRYSFKRC